MDTKVEAHGSSLLSLGPPRVTFALGGPRAQSRLEPRAWPASVVSGFSGPRDRGSRRKILRNPPDFGVFLGSRTVSACPDLR